MSLEYLTMDITYQVKDGHFDIAGDVNEQGQSTLIETFLHSQLGRGVDDSKPNEQDVYHITFKWYPEDDTIRVASDTGNKGLRDGILISLLHKLG